ncbi:MAG TPA: hypothetical protein VH682_14605 [Gemmataceae bacterium]|jgi:hypothetical protein
MIERRFRLALLCLPLLAVPAAGSDTNGLGEPTEDLFSLWRTFSAYGRQAAPAEAANADAVYPWLTPQPADVAPRILPPPPPNPLLDLAAVPSTNGSGTPELGLWDTTDRKPRKVSQKSQGWLGSLDTQVEVTDTLATNIWDEPSWKRTWQTDDSWQLGLAGPLSVFGQVGANSDEAGQSNMKVSGRTGLACKVPVAALAEVTLRSGPGVSYTDPLHPLRTTERSDWLLEVQARWPLLFGIGLEYQGSALPSLTPLQQDMINQDLRLAMQLGSTAKVKLGAKRQWSGVLDQRATGTDNTQLYLGLELSH